MADRAARTTRVIAVREGAGVARGVRRVPVRQPPDWGLAWLHDLVFEALDDEDVTRLRVARFDGSVRG